MKVIQLRNSFTHQVFNLILLLSAVFLLGSCKGREKLGEDLVSPKSVSLSPKADIYNTAVSSEWNDLHLSLLKNNQSLTSLSAARSLGYVNLALYESMVHGTNNKSLSGRLQGFSNVPKPIDSLEYNWGLAANVAQCTMIQSFFPKATASEQARIDSLLSKYEKLFRTNASQVVIKRSIEYGASVANAVWNYARTDGLNGTDSSLFDANYVFPTGLGVWKPDSPQIKPLLPQWKLLRPMIFSNKYFAATNLVPFSYRKESVFFAEASRLFQVSKNLTGIQKDKSIYWVGNELGNNAVRNVFSVLNGAVKRKNIKLDEAALLYLKGAILVFDGTIAVWNNKYETNLIRPDTYIKETIDKNWLPFQGKSYSPSFPSLSATLAGGIGKLLEKELGGVISTPFSTSLISNADFKSEVIAAEVNGGTNFAFSAESGFALGEKIMKNTIDFGFK